MNKLTNKKIIFLDVFTLFLALFFPFLRSQDHELYMTIFSVVAVLMFFSNVWQVKFSYKSDLNIEDNLKVAMLIWAKMFIICSLLNVGVQAIYLDQAIADTSSLNAYSHKAIIGWELVVWMFRTVLFYVPIISGLNAVLYLLTVLVAKAFKQSNAYQALVKLINKFNSFVKKTIESLSVFNGKILAFIKTNKTTREVDYLAMNTQLIKSDKEAQVPPLFQF